MTITTAARKLATLAGASLAVMPGVAYDTGDAALAAMAEALLARLVPVGANLIALRREHSCLIALVDDSRAEVPLCPGAFGRVVRQLSFDLLGEAWEARLVIQPLKPIATRPAARRRSVGRRPGKVRVA